MAIYAIRGETLEGLGNAIRSVIGSTKRYTPEEMIEEVANIMNAATYILVDKDGNEYPAVYVDSEIAFTATENDIRLGKTAITGAGIVTGTKDIPNYRAEEGSVIIDVGEPLDVYTFSDMCQYTTLQMIVCDYNTCAEDSVSAKHVVIEGNVYNVGSVDVLSKVTVDADMQSINLGLTNNTENPLMIRYMIIKEDT